jgi:glucokinase
VGSTSARLCSSELHVPCRIDNDALTAALGEWTYGAGQGARRLLMVTLGTGIGVAVINDGTPYVGTDGIAPESGHIRVAGARSPCYCGLTNCWEQAASRTSLQRLALAAVTPEIAAKGPQEAVAHLARNPSQSDVFTTFAKRLALGLATLLTVHRPDVVVLGGSAAEYFDLIEPGLHKHLARRPAYYAPMALHRAALGDLSGAIGAACLSDNQH